MKTVDSIAQSIAISHVPTAIFLGAGSSISSGAPSGTHLSQLISDEFFPTDKIRTLSDIAGRVEAVFGRKPLVDFLRLKLRDLSPSDAMKMLPHFNFSNIFTTNYDTLVEKSFSMSNNSIPIVRSNKDYSFDQRQYNTILYKIHGCLSEDRCDGFSHGMIITDEDYTTYEKYRQIVFREFEKSLITSNVIFIGYSMSDSNIRDYVEKSIEIAKSQECLGKIYLILYEEDQIEALRWENRGIEVAFGDLDRLLASLSTQQRAARIHDTVSIFSPVSNAPRHLIAAEISSVNPESESTQRPNLKRLFSGGEATYADIKHGFTFSRTISNEIVNHVKLNSIPTLNVVLGPSGTGKTTIGRMALLNLQNLGYICYEHKSNIGVDPETWKDIDREHSRKGEKAVLFCDEPNASQFAINEIATYLTNGSDHAMSLILTYHPSIWSFRTKSASLTKLSRKYDAKHLSPADIEYISSYLKNRPELSSLMSEHVRGMSHREIERVIRAKANSDLFVSLKYIFETKSLDEIILSEYSQILKSCPDNLRSDVEKIYKITSLLESLGRNVHRQMVLRVCDIDISNMAQCLNFLDGLVVEFERDDNVEGAYIWKTRHSRIASILAQSKFSYTERRNIVEEIIRCVNGASKIERQFCVFLCNSDIGIESFQKKDQTELYRMLSDALPNERVPRHRLIRNLIREKRFGEAELAISESRDMRINDSVVFRYDVDLNVAKAEHLEFLDDADRRNLLETAVSKATSSVTRRPDDMHNYDSLCRASLALALSGGDINIYRKSVSELKLAYDRIGDELMLRWIGKYESELSRISKSYHIQIEG